MSAGGCQAHSCGVAVPINDRVTKVPGSPKCGLRGGRWRWGAAGRCFGDREPLLGMVCAGTSWRISLGRGSPGYPTCTWEVPGSAIPVDGIPMVEGRNLDGRWSSGCLRAGPETLQFLWPRSRVFFLLLLVFVQFPNPELVLWHQAAAFSSSSSSQMLVNHWFISSWP